MKRTPAQRMHLRLELLLGLGPALTAAAAGLALGLIVRHEWILAGIAFALGTASGYSWVYLRRRFWIPSKPTMLIPRTGRSVGQVRRVLFVDRKGEGAVYFAGPLDLDPADICDTILEEEWLEGSHLS